jgi:hypothetical protein
MILSCYPIVGKVAPESYQGLKVQGSYGELWLIQTDYVPEAYFAVVATYSANSSNNVIGVRQHRNTLYQGLRIIPGSVPAYPLQDSYFARAFGVGVRHRGAAAVTQFNASGAYENPVIAK